MNILMFGWEYPPSVSGGLGTACRDLSEGLRDQGAHIVFVVPRDREEIRTARLHVTSGAGLDLPEEAPSPGIPAEWPREPLLTPYLSAAGPDTGQRPYGADLQEELIRYARRARAVARETPCHIIAAHDWAAVPAALAARDERKVPLVFHVHSLESDRSPLRINEYLYGLERRGMMEADHIIAVSHYTKQHIMRQYGVAGEKISVVHNAPPAFPPAPRQNGRNESPAKVKTVLFLGRITYQKGPLHFMEAAAVVAADDPDVRFIVAGSGDLLDTMKEAADAAGIADRFVFTGFLDRREEVADVYRSSSLYVMPSVSEPFGMTALEAIHHGVPVILSQHSGVSEVLPRCPAVDFRDRDALARTMAGILADEALARDIVRAGREDCRNLTWYGQAGTILDRYRSIAEGAGRHPAQPG